MRNYKTFATHLLTAAAISASSMLSVADPSPTLIPFQGRLTDQAGTPYVNGQFTITFNLYDQAVGGTAVWTERHEKVSVINGTINAFLGAITSLDTVDFSMTKHLGIAVDPDDNPATPQPEMVPRTMILPAFHSKNTEKLAGSDWSSLLVSGNDPEVGQVKASKIETDGITENQIATGAVTSDEISDGTIVKEDFEASFFDNLALPPGTIIPYAGAGSPGPTWRRCDGAAYDKDDPQFAALFAAIGTAWGDGTTGGSSNANTDFNVPDLRGVFLRGWSYNGGGQDPDRLTRDAPWKAAGQATGDHVGSLQESEFKAHAHNTIANTALGGFSGIDPASSKHVSKRVGNHSHSENYNLSGTATAPTLGESSTDGGSETRPTNANVNFIIKL